MQTVQEQPTAARGHGAHAKQGFQQGRHEDAGRHVVLLAHARHVLRVLLAARRHDDQAAPADKDAEYLLRRAVTLLPACVWLGAVPTE